MKDEILDLVNKYDEVIGTIARNSLNQNHIIRIVSVMLLNSNNEILLGVKHKREHAPEWSIVGTGHVSAGEDPLIAAKREVHEETGIRINDIIFFEKVFVQNYICSAFIYSYQHMCNESNIVLDEHNQEFAYYEWVKIESPHTIPRPLTVSARTALERLTKPEETTV